MRLMRVALFFAMMTMIFNTLLFTMYDRVVQGFVNYRYLGLTSILSFLSGFAAFYAFTAMGATTWLT